MREETKRSGSLRYSVPELAEKLGLSGESIYRALRRKEIPHIRIGRRLILPKAAIDAWLESANTTTVQG